MRTPILPGCINPVFELICQNSATGKSNAGQAEARAGRRRARCRAGFARRHSNWQKIYDIADGKLKMVEYDSQAVGTTRKMQVYTFSNED
jgi:predicted neutral ceramidase superfamily lipid hydrolase